MTNLICSAHSCSEAADTASAPEWPLCALHLAEARTLLSDDEDA